MRLAAFVECHDRRLIALALAMATAASAAMAIHDLSPYGRDEVAIPGPPWLNAPGAPRHRISGHVYLGRVATRALVHLRADVADASLWRGFDVMTAVDGSFDFGSLPAGAYQLFAEQGQSRISQIVHVHTDGRARNEQQDGDDVELYLEPCQMHVVDVRGALNDPVVGANLWRAGVWTGRTSHDGNAMVCALRDEELVARASGLVSGRDWVGIEGGDAYIMRLTNSIELSGRVVGPDGEPWAGALVQLTAEEGCEHIGSDVWAGRLDAAVTDHDGVFHVALEDRPPERVRLCVRLGDRVWELDDRTRAHGTQLELLVFGPGRPLESSPATVGVVHGRVTCHGVPVADALIVHEGDPFISQDRARTRWDGTFTLLLRSEGADTISIWLRSTGSDRFSVAVVPGAVVNRDIEITCSPGG